jgi:hypothetical protein
MIKKYCENCGNKFHKSNSSKQANDYSVDYDHEAFMQYMDDDEDENMEHGMDDMHFMDDDEDDMDTAAMMKYMDDDEDMADKDAITAPPQAGESEEDEEMSHKAMLEVGQLTNSLDKVAHNLEKLGNKRLAHRVDMVSDLLDEFRRAQRSV